MLTIAPGWHVPTGSGVLRRYLLPGRSVQKRQVLRVRPRAPRLRCHRSARLCLLPDGENLAVLHTFRLCQERAMLRWRWDRDLLRGSLLSKHELSWLQKRRNLPLLASVEGARYEIARCTREEEALLPCWRVSPLAGC